MLHSERSTSVFALFIDKFFGFSEKVFAAAFFFFTKMHVILFLNDTIVFLVLALSYLQIRSNGFRMIFISRYSIQYV